MKNFVFKINVSKQTLSSISSEDEYNDLIVNQIPTALNFIFETNLVESDSTILEIKFEENEDEKKEREDFFYSKFNDLQVKTNELLIMYKEVVDRYRKSGDVVYPKDFNNLTSECGRLRNILIQKYPQLEKIKLISDEEILESYSIPTEYKVGKAITHLKQFYKINELVNRNLIFNNNRPKTYYHPNQEWLIISSNKKEIAIEHAKWINRVLNRKSSFTDNIGKIQINPVYSELIISDNIKKIEFTITYPNGPSSRRDKYLTNLLKDANGDELKTEIISKGKNLNNESIKDTLNYASQQGYLKDATTTSSVEKGSGIIFDILKITMKELIERGKDNE